MPWAKLDDRFHENRKVRKAWRQCPTAIGLHVLALTYCAGHLTDGLVDEEFVQERLPAARMRERVLSVLIGCELWFPVDKGWLINDYLEYNPTRADVETQRSKKSAAGKSGANARWGDGTSMAGAMQVPIAPAIALASQGNAPDPTRPDPTRTPTATSAAPTSAVCSDLFAYWQEKTGHSASKLTRDRRAKIEARLNEGYDPDQIRKAIDGAARAAFVNENGKKFDDIELICRTGSKLESFIERSQVGSTVVPLRPSGKPGPSDMWRAINGDAG